MRKSHFFEMLIIFFVSLTPLLWFRPGQMMLGHDNVFPLDPKEFLSGRLTTWSPHGFGQNQSLIMGTSLIHFIDAIPYLLGFSVIPTQQIIYVFWFFMIGISMYVLTKTLGKSGWFSIVATLMYQFNFFILQGWWIGERTKFSAYIALPLVLSVFFKVSRKEWSVISGIAANTLILFLFNGGGLYGVPLFGGFFISIGIFIVLYSMKNGMRLIALALGTMMGSLVVNAYFWLPAITTLVRQYKAGIVEQGGVSGLIDWATEISANTSFINLLRLQGIAEWYDNPEHPYAKLFLTNPWLILASFVWPFLVLFVIRRSKDKEQNLLISFFLLVYLIGILFAAGTHPPLGFIYIFFVKTIPGFAIFRTPYFKFAPAIYLAVSFLCASAIDKVPAGIKKWVFVLFAVFVLIYHFPFFTGEFFSWRKGFSTRLAVPSYIFDFGSWLNNEKKDDSRVLMLPPNSPDLRYSMYDWGYLSFQSITTLLSNQSVIINNDRLNDEEKSLVLTLYQAIADRNKSLFTKLTKILRIGYIVIQKDTASDVKTDLPVGFEIYEEVLENDFGFVPLKVFGRWAVYAIDSNPMSSMVIAPSANRLDSLTDEVWKYYNFSTNPFFVRNADLPSNLQILQNGQYIIADCINCKAKDKPFIKFPDRNILPGSPFYPLMLWNEDRNLNKGDTKSLIYDYLGVSLKRIAEVREMVKDSKPIPATSLRRFIALMESLSATFEKLSKYEDKIDIGDDAQFYLESERNALTELLGIYVISGDQVNAVGQFTQAISSVLGTIEPFVLIPDQMTHRLYQIRLDQPEMFAFSIYTGDFDSINEDDVQISLSIDQQVVADQSIKIHQKPSWVKLGARELGTGTHYVMLTYPETPSVVNTLKAETTEFNTSSDMGCFTGDIEYFSYKKLYRVKVNYNNNFSNELFFNIWEFSNGQKRLKNVFRLPPSQVKGEFIRLIKTYADTQGAQIGFCSRGLTEDILKKNLLATVNEILYPTVFFVGQNEQTLPVGNVQMKKINNTTYDISFTTFSEHSILTFFQRYDPGWKLSEFGQNHFRMNGYANGWLIEKPGSYHLQLAFEPQKTFTTGIKITIASFVGAIALFWWKQIKKH